MLRLAVLVGALTAALTGMLLALLSNMIGWYFGEHVSDLFLIGSASMLAGLYIGKSWQVHQMIERELAEHIRRMERYDEIERGLDELSERLVSPDDLDYLDHPEGER